ncbi:MAG: hypothetical protein ABH827_04425, partial [bacterium]
MYCQYYQAHILKSKAWFISGIFRNEENIAFLRALNNDSNIFEFFVPTESEPDFLKYMSYLLKHGYIFSLEKLPNRIQQQLES